MAFIEFQKVNKIYQSGDVKVHALKGAGFQIEKGEICVIVGQSGAGPVLSPVHLHVSAFWHRPSGQ